MTLSNLKLANFKTYVDLDVDFCSNINCLVGNNGVGKTNLLDAIYYLSFCKSYFNPIDTQNIRAGEQFFAIHGTYRSDEDSVLVSCVLKSGQPKQMRWNKKVYKSLSEHIGRLPLVIVSPNDQSIILGGSEVRRKFVDGILSQTDKGYLDHLLQYSKALEQRNKILKQFAEDRYWEEPSIQIWDEQLVRHGEVLYAGRKTFMEEFSSLFTEYYNWISENHEQAVLKYVSNSDVPLQQQLMESRQHDKYAQYTTVGPHKDDLELCIGEFLVKRYGSQGQQKTFLLALKLAQFEYIYRKCGTKPTLLLDDIFDKLDMLRVKQLIHLVGSERFGQVFITDTQPGRIESIFEEIPHVEHRIFSVTEGKLNEIKNA